MTAWSYFMNEKRTHFRREINTRDILCLFIFGPLCTERDYTVLLHCQKTRADSNFQPNTSSSEFTALKSVWKKARKSEDRLRSGEMKDYTMRRFSGDIDCKTARLTRSCWLYYLRLLADLEPCSCTAAQYCRLSSPNLIMILDCSRLSSWWRVKWAFAHALLRCHVVNITSLFRQNIFYIPIEALWSVTFPNSGERATISIHWLPEIKSIASVQATVKKEINLYRIRSLCCIYTCMSVCMHSCKKRSKNY